MTALQLAREASAAAGLEEITTLGSGEDGRQALALMNRAGRDLAEKRGIWGNCWPMLNRTRTVEVVSGREFYPLPADFGGIIPDTAWDTRRRWPAVGPVSPSEWATLKNSVAGSASPSFFWRVWMDYSVNRESIQIHPIPTVNGTFDIDYLSSFWVSTTEGAAPIKAAIADDSDVPIFADELMILALEWRLRSASGLAFSVQLGEFELRRDRIFAYTTGDSSREMDLHSRGIGGVGNVSVATDDDTPGETERPEPPPPVAAQRNFLFGLSETQVPDVAGVVHSNHGSGTLPSFVNHYINIYVPATDSDIDTVTFSDDTSNENNINSFTKRAGVTRYHGTNYNVWVSNQLLTHPSSVIMTVS